MPRDHAQGPVVTSRERLLVQCTGECGLSFNPSVGEGTVGVLDRETCNFSWEPSKMGSQEVTLELGREGHVGSLPSGEGGGKTAFQGDRTVCAGGRGGPIWGPRLNRRCSVWLDARCPCSLVGTHSHSRPHSTHQTQLDHCSTWGQETQAEEQGAASPHPGVGICGGPGSGPRFLHMGNGDKGSFPSGLLSRSESQSSQGSPDKRFLNQGRMGSHPRLGRHSTICPHLPCGWKGNMGMKSIYSTCIHFFWCQADGQVGDALGKGYKPHSLQFSYEAFF